MAQRVKKLLKYLNQKLTAASDPVVFSMKKNAPLRQNLLLNALLICFVLPIPFAVHGQTVFIPLNHWVYEYINRMESKGILTHVLADTKPLTRQEVAGYLKKLISLQEQDAVLNSVEADQLAFLRYEFSEELDGASSEAKTYNSRFKKWFTSKSIDKYIPDVLYANGRNFFSYSTEMFKIYWDPIFKRSGLWAEADTLTGQERVFESTNGFTFWGGIGSHFGFLCDIRDTKEWGTRVQRQRGRARFREWLWRSYLSR